MADAWVFGTGNEEMLVLGHDALAPSSQDRTYSTVRIVNRTESHTRIYCVETASVLTAHTKWELRDMINVSTESNRGITSMYVYEAITPYVHLEKNHLG